MDVREDKLRKADAVMHRLSRRNRPRGINHRRLARTLSLGTLAVAAAIYWLAVEYGVDLRDLVGHLGASAVFVLLFAALAIGGALIFSAFRWLRARRRKKPDAPAP